MWLFQEAHESTQNSDQRDVYHHNARLCRVALETAVGSLPFHMSATKDTVYAFFLGVRKSVLHVRDTRLFMLTGNAWHVDCEACTCQSTNIITPSMFLC